MNSSADLTVVKIGGSVLTGIDGYRQSARLLSRLIVSGHDSIVAVVSAEQGHTDLLLREAREISGEPDSTALDLLWSTGELRSVALLTLALQAEGVAATGLSVHELGLRASAAAIPDENGLDLNPLTIRAALGRAAVVVVPGFLALRHQQIVTLGRGGSDWSAVVLAAALSATECVLVKDVDGYFTADPREQSDARPIPELSYGDAIAMADDGCPLVQRQALVAAQRFGVRLHVRGVNSPGTCVADFAFRTQDSGLVGLSTPDPGPDQVF